MPILALILLALLPSAALAQGIGTLDQWAATTSPTAAITQRTFGKDIKITGLPVGECLTLDSDSLLTTTTCGSGAGGGAVDSVNGQTGTVVLDSGDIAEGSNLYFTDARARAAIGELVPGLEFNAGVLSLSAGYAIPLSASTTEWSTAYSWGDHATAGYLTTEADPVFTASDASGISAGNISNWNTAFGWGNHALAGYLTGNQTITLSGDASGSGATAITVAVANDSHSHTGSTVSGLDISADTNLSVTATGLSLSGDSVALAAGYTIPRAASTTEWATAYGWGDHAAAGYLTDYTVTEADVTAHEAALSITESQITDLTHYTDADIAGTEAAFTGWDTNASDDFSGAYADLTGQPTIPTNNTELTNGAGFITDGNTGWDNSYGFITSADDTVSGTELDGVFSTTGLLRRTAAGTYSTITDSSANWNTAYSWGDHAAAGYLTSYTETDPVFSASDAFSITGTNITNWNSAYGWGNHASAGYFDALADFTGTLTDGRLCTYDQVGGEIDCNTSGAGAGTVTSVALTAPTGLTVSGSPVTDAGTLALALDTGYVIPRSASTTDWQTAFSWGNHASVGYLTSVDISDDTNLTGDAEIVLTGDSLSLAASIARDSELHSSVTLIGESYLSLLGQEITASDVSLTTNVSGTLPVANGGTGATSLTNLIALATHTTGNFVATITGTANEISVSGSGSENAGVTLSLPSTIDLGGKTLEIPNGTAPVANDPGELAHDTTDNQLVLDDRVIRTTEKIFSFTLASSSPDFASGGVIPVPPEIDGYAVTELRCFVEGGTSKVMTLTDGTNAMDSLTCGTSVTSDDGAIANSSVTAGEKMQVNVGASSGAPDYVTFAVYGLWTRE